MENTRMIDKSNLKAWAHWALLSPIDEHQKAHAEATKDLIIENEALALEVQRLTKLQVESAIALKDLIDWAEDYLYNKKVPTHDAIFPARLVYEKIKNG